MKKLRTSSKLVPDCIDYSTLRDWMANPNFGEFQAYKQTYGQIVETMKFNQDSTMTHRYWKFIKIHGHWISYEVHKDGTVIAYGKSFTLT